MKLIAHTRLLSDPEFYVSSYYSGCSYEQTRDKLAGDARVADPKASRRLPRMIYIDILPVSLVVTTWALVVRLPYLAFAFRDSLKSCNNDDVEHKLYLDFPLL